MFATPENCNSGSHLKDDLLVLARDFNPWRVE